MWFRQLRCSFCRRSDKDVAKLVAGAKGYICYACAFEAVRIMETTPPAPAVRDSRATTVQHGAASWHRAWHFAATQD